MFIKWKERLGQPFTGHSIREAIRPVLQEWVECKKPLTFRLVQALSGHDCFGRYIYIVIMARRELTPQYHQCDALVSVISSDISLLVIVKSIVENESSWQSLFRRRDNANFLPHNEDA